MIYTQLFFQAGEATGVSPYLLMAGVYQESRFKPNAVSQSGAMGLGQIMPETWFDAWSRWGALIDPDDPKGDPFNPRHSIFLMAYHLKWLTEQMGGDVWWALIAYLRGVGRAGELRQAGVFGVCETDEVAFDYANDIVKRMFVYQEMLKPGRDLATEGVVSERGYRD